MDEPNEIDVLTDILTGAWVRSYTQLAEGPDEDKQFVPDIAVQAANSVLNGVATVMSTPPQPEPGETATELETQRTGDAYVVPLGDSGRIYLTPIRDVDNVPILKLTWIIEHNRKVYTITHELRGGPPNLT